MALALDGASTQVEARDVAIEISASHPLIKLAKMLPWLTLISLCMEDLKKTTAKGQWWRGRKLYVRIHLGVYLLQKLYDLTDRQVEYGVRDNAAYRLFCGYGIIEGWRAPDHTKVEEFRSRLSPETQRLIANTLAEHAVQLGFGDPSDTDFDSTVQEANIAYPSDASLMSKLAGLGRKVIDYLKEKSRGLLPEGLAIDMKGIKEKARAYFFTKSSDIEARREALGELHRYVKQQLRPMVDICENLDARRLAMMPWNIKRAVEQINAVGWRYLLDVAHFLRRQTMKPGKIMSLHAKAIACIKKGKVHKDKEFGRVFQLGRIKGNFLFVAASTSVRMEDKHSIAPLVQEHARLFGEGKLNSATADKGYFSAANVRLLKNVQVKDIGLQPKANTKRRADLAQGETMRRLRDRRAGIEPLIGHAKHGGQLGKSRMKSDAATLAAGYASVSAFNIRQLVRHQSGKMKKRA